MGYLDGYRETAYYEVIEIRILARIGSFPKSGTPPPAAHNFGGCKGDAMQKKPDHIVDTTPENLAEGFIFQEKRIREIARHNISNLKDEYEVRWASVDRLKNIAQRDLSVDLPDLPDLPRNGYYAGMIKLADYCKQAENILTGRTKLKRSLESDPANRSGCIPKDAYKWQTVQRKIKDHWKLLKKEGHGFPSFRKLAEELVENAGTVKKAIQYDIGLTRAYNKDKPEGKKIKRIDPSKIDFVGIKVGRKGGKKDPMYEEQRERLILQIKTEARKQSKDFEPDVKAYGKMVMRNIKSVSCLEIDGLKDLLTDLKEQRINRAEKFKVAFQLNKL